MAIEQQMALAEKLLECRSKVAQMAVELKEVRARVKKLDTEVIFWRQEAQKKYLKEEES